MPRLSEKDKQALCSHEKDTVDRETCMKEYDYYSDYQELKQSGKFTSDFNEYKKSIGLGVITWGDTSDSKIKAENKKSTSDSNKNRKWIFGVSIGVGVLLLGYMSYIAYKKYKNN